MLCCYFFCRRMSRRPPTSLFVHINSRQCNFVLFYPNVHFWTKTKTAKNKKQNKHKHGTYFINIFSTRQINNPLTHFGIRFATKCWHAELSLNIASLMHTENDNKLKFINNLCEFLIFVQHQHFFLASHPLVLFGPVIKMYFLYTCHNFHLNN